MNGRKNSYQVPDGYFDSLKTRLEAIPAMKSGLREVSLWQRVQPYAALAACFVLALVVGNIFLGGPAAESEEAGLQDFYYSHLTSVEEPMAIFYEDYESSVLSASEDDILEYLISTGTTADYVAYMLNQ